MFDAGRIRIGYVLRSASMLVNVKVQLGKSVDGQRISPSTMQKDVLVATSTSTTCLGPRVLGKSTYSVSMSRTLYKAPGPHSSITSKLMLISAFKGNSVICMRRSMN